MRQMDESGHRATIGTVPAWPAVPSRVTVIRFAPEIAVTLARDELDPRAADVGLGLVDDRDTIGIHEFAAAQEVIDAECNLHDPSP